MDSRRVFETLSFGAVIAANVAVTIYYIVKMVKA